MSKYGQRFSRFPRPVTARDSKLLHGLGQPPTTRDVVNSYPMPIRLAGLGQEDVATESDTVLNPQDVQNQQNLQRQLPIWLYPPINWENIDQLAYALLPAIGSTVSILTFQVPIGRNGVINKVATNFVGGGWIEGSGDLVWRILLDGTPPPGATSYDTVLASLGSPAQPVGISGFRIFENQTLTVVAFNNPSGANGGIVVSGQRVGARIMGHLYPRSIEEDQIWV